VGIEEAGQLDVLKDLGCDQGQGYLFARPGDAAAAALLVPAILGRRGGGRLRAEPPSSVIP